MNIYEYTCTLFMNKLDIKQRKEDLKKITKTGFFYFNAALCSNILES